MRDCRQKSQESDGIRWEAKYTSGLIRGEDKKMDLIENRGSCIKMERKLISKLSTNRQT